MRCSYFIFRCHFRLTFMNTGGTASKRADGCCHNARTETQRNVGGQGSSNRLRGPAKNQRGIKLVFQCVCAHTYTLIPLLLLPLLLLRPLSHLLSPYLLLLLRFPLLSSKFPPFMATAVVEPYKFVLSNHSPLTSTPTSPPCSAMKPSTASAVAPSLFSGLEATA